MPRKPATKKPQSRHGRGHDEGRRALGRARHDLSAARTKLREARRDGAAAGIDAATKAFELARSKFDRLRRERFDAIIQIRISTVNVAIDHLMKLVTQRKYFEVMRPDDKRQIVEPIGVSLRNLAATLDATLEIRNRSTADSAKKSNGEAAEAHAI